MLPHPPSKENTQTNFEQTPDTMPRGFKGLWIPREIWLHPDLDASEKCLWAEIDSLDRGPDGGCTASNEYLMKFMGLRQAALRDKLAHLIKLGLIYVEHFDGRIRTLRSSVKTLFQQSASRKVDCRNTSMQEDRIPAPSSPDSPRRTLYKRTKKREKILIDRGPDGPPSPDQKDENLDKGEKCEEKSILEKRDFSGNVVICSLEDIIRESVQNGDDFRLTDLKEAFQRLAEWNGPIRSAYAYVKGTVLNIVKARNNERYRSGSWQKKKNSPPTPSGAPPSTTIPQSAVCSGDISVEDLKASPFPAYRLEES